MAQQPGLFVPGVFSCHTSPCECLCHIPPAGALPLPEGQAVNTSHSLSTTLSEGKQIK